VVWAYRLFLDREPESEDVIGPKLAGSRDSAELRRHLMTSAEFQLKNHDYAHTNDRTVVITELGLARLFVDLSDHVIGLNIVRGRYEEEGIAFVRSVLAPGDTAVDAGAHIGFFTMQMAAMVGRRTSSRVRTVRRQRGSLGVHRRNRFNDRVVFPRAASVRPRARQR
jgi:hypothetical protein